MVCNVAKAPDTPDLEAPLLAELARIERGIADLEAQRATLQGMITRYRQENIPLKDVSRKNSFKRIITEKKILETIAATPTHARADAIFRAACTVHFGLKESTFRSYLHRLKERGLIESSRERGYWKFARKEPAG